MKAAAVVWVIVIVTLWCRPAQADMPDGVAAAYVVDKFYRTCLRLEPEGLPTRVEMKRFAPLLSKDLAVMIEEARNYDMKLRRDDPRLAWLLKPGGSVFTSLREGFEYYGIGLPVIQGDIATVPVQLEYRFRGRAARWIDVMVLERSSSTKDWEVVDIYFNAPWAFVGGASLRARLHDVLAPVPVPEPSLSSPAKGPPAATPPMPGPVTTPPSGSEVPITIRRALLP